MFLGPSTFRTLAFVLIALTLAFIVTGFANSAYRREKRAMGERHFARGQQLAAHGDPKAAAEEYRQALLFQPDNADYRLSLASTLIDAGRLNEAESHIEELLQEDPTDPDINLLRGRLALKRNRLNIATEYYQRAVYEYWPPDKAAERREARWELVDLLSKTGQRNALVAELIQLYADTPHSADEKAKIGFLLLNNGAASEALQVFRDLTKQQPSNAKAHFGLAQVHFSQGDFVSARHEYQHAAHLDPHDPQITQALAVTNEVIDMDPELPSISAEERFRRSQNLLSRVVKDLRQCPATPSPAAAPAASPPAPEPATKRLFEQLKDKLASPLGGKSTKASSNAGTGNSNGAPAGTAAVPPAPSAMEQRLAAAQNLLAMPRREDTSSELQNTAESLWQDRAQICGAAPVNDRALETVMARVGRE